MGAGSAGASLAGHLARAGREVLLLDRRPRGATGARWVNGVPAWMFEVAGVDAPRGDELFKHGGAFVMRPLGAKTTVAHRESGELLHVDMRRLVDRLVDEAVGLGVRFVRASVRDASIERDRATVCADFVGGESATLHARLVVDASGLGAVVRRTCGAAGMVAAVDRHDICGAAQYQFEITRPDALVEWLEAHDAVPGDDVAIPGVAGGYSTLTLFTRPELAAAALDAGLIDAETFSAALLQRPMRPSRRSLEALVGRSARSPIVAARFGPAIARALVAERLGRLDEGRLSSWLVGRAAVPDKRPRIINPLHDSTVESAG